MKTRQDHRQLAWDTILQKPVCGIPTWEINVMEWRFIDRFAGVPEGTYAKKPVEIYRAAYENLGICMVDQWIPTNPLSMTERGYVDDQPRGATTGGERIVCDGLLIDGPEAVVDHMGRFLFPEIEKAIAEFDEARVVAEMLAHERQVQQEMGSTMLKAPYIWPLGDLPGFEYGRYGYEHYFSAYALYPEVMETHFKLRADLALLRNRAGARAITEAGLPPYLRLDHDMADNRGTLVGIRSLDQIWFPHLARCLEPLVGAGVRLVWHCDGNLMDMVPRLIALGVKGFQGFQYEAGMDYEKICQMKTRDGEDLIILAGVSVTTTLPYGTPKQVRGEMKWLVEGAPRTGLFLGASSSIAPGVPWENLETLAEGFAYYRERGRKR